MKIRLIRLLLRFLNSRWLNPSPCRYGFIGNIDAISLDHLKSEEAQRPGITVATVITEAEAWKSCPMREHGLIVMEDGIPREGTAWDVHELRQALTPKDRRQ